MPGAISIVNHAINNDEKALQKAECCQRPELLSPAGDWECARAAVENGADAIYFGLERFNARMRAHNFKAADLPELMSFLHGRGVKGYVTFNTLVFANEIEAAEETLRTIISAGVDAVIVQDAGICRLIRKLSSDFPIHASTQMTITSPAGVDFARELDCAVVVLARECSIKELEIMQRAQPLGREIGLEVFVHGALCVAYSGQCLTSESLGGRSANRGECAQACRMPYELLADGRLVPLGDKRYLLSPQDLAGLEVLPELIRLGVHSFKIEGRLKTPEYVASITRVYRQAIDKILSSSGVPVRGRQAMDNLVAESRYELEMAFSRGLSTGWFKGIDNQRLVHARFGKKRGVYLGEVSRIEGEDVYAKLQTPLKTGDGVVFDAGRPDENEEGGRVYQLDSKGPETRLRFGRGALCPDRIRAGDKIWKTSDPELQRRLKKTYQGRSPAFTRGLVVSIHGQEGEPLRVIARDEQGRQVEASSPSVLVRSQNQPLTTERLREQFGRLGGTSFHLQRLENALQGEVILPISELNHLRRTLVADLALVRGRSQQWKLTDSIEIGESRVKAASPPNSSPELIVLIRSIPQLEAALALECPTVYCEFEDPKKYREAVKLFRSWQSSAGARASKETAIMVAPPRITKGEEEWILRQVESSEADGYLIRNYDHLRFFSKGRRIGDFSLNVANPITAEFFKEEMRLERLTASYDLNMEQLGALLGGSSPDWFEVTIHQHMPMFHMEHCVFCAFLSEGTDYRNCGRPCDRHQVKLRDRTGAEHVLRADAGCRNTLFNARAQSGAEFVPQLLRCGVRFFRVEFLDESPDQMKKSISLYRDLLAGRRPPKDIWGELKVVNQLGVTRGTIGSAS